MPASYDITMEQGAQFVLPFRLYSDAAKTQLIDYSAYTAAKMQVRKSKGSDSVVCEITMSDGEIVLTDDAGPNNLTITISTAKSRLIPPGFVGYYDILLTDASSEDHRDVEGQFTASAKVTTNE